jgi:predicted RNase H-related nuclease YkuK (DUF458 family)
VHLEIHLDLGPNGTTLDVLTPCWEWSADAATTCVPNRIFGATTIADKHSK